MTVKISLIVYVAILSGSIWCIGTTTSGLGPQVGIYLDFSGNTATYIPRDDYVHTIVFLTLIAPLAAIFVVYKLPRAAPALSCLPNKWFWFAPEQKKMTVAYLARHGIWLATIVVVFFTAVNWAVVEANAVIPVRYPMRYLAGVLGLTWLALFVWLYLLYRRFKLAT